MAQCFPEVLITSLSSQTRGHREIGKNACMVKQCLSAELTNEMALSSHEY